MMSDGFQLCYRRCKPTTDRRGAILCIHGTGENSEFFRPVGEDLAKAGYEVYAVDLRGFGLSTEEDLLRGDTHSFKRHLQDLVEVMTLIRGEHPTEAVFLLGHSHGCAYALWCAANHPELIRGVVLAAPPVESTSKVNKRQYAKFALLLLFAPKSMFSFGDRGKPDPRIPQDSPVAESVSIRWLYGSKKLLLDPLFGNAARMLSPVLILQGKRDTVTLPQGARNLLERLGTQDKTMHLFEGADHFLYDEFVPTRGSGDTVGRRVLVDVLVGWLDRITHL
ncbi:MAG: alpha/beta hydrolase [Nitrososphaerales archaeon]|nr:alpha/beta hydrolase [Nitrososphaerales archaeon]